MQSTEKERTDALKTSGQRHNAHLKEANLVSEIGGSVCKLLL
jgi:hypothetical protein